MANAYRLTFAAFDAHLAQAVRITRMRLGEPPDDERESALRKLEGEDDDARPYTGFAE